jgi:hypothetical protein
MCMASIRSSPPEASPATGIWDLREEGWSSALVAIKVSRLLSMVSDFSMVIITRAAAATKSPAGPSDAAVPVAKIH